MKTAEALLPPQALYSLAGSIQKITQNKSKERTRGAALPQAAPQAHGGLASHLISDLILLPFTDVALNGAGS